MQVRNSEILLDIVEAAKKAKVAVKELSWGGYEEYGTYNPSTAARRFGSWLAARKAASRANPAKLQAEIRQFKTEEARDTKRAQVLDSYLKVVKESGESPKVSDLAEIGVTRDSIARSFGSMTNLDQAAREASPQSFRDVHIHSLLGRKAVQNLSSAVKKHKRFVVTTAVTGCKVHVPFYRSLKKYCELNDAALLVLVSSDPAHNRDAGNKNLPMEERYGTLDKILAGEIIVLQDTALNNNLNLSTLKTSAKMIDPLAGTERIGQRNGSFIIASPKQRQKVVATSNHKLPHVSMTTGAITQSNYNTSNYMSERLAYFADNDHQIGAIVVEVQDDEIFHFRQIQADEEGCFIDIAGQKALQYSDRGTKAVKAEALVLGDWHSGETDMEVAGAWKDLAKTVSPEFIVLHDAFNGLSINHHEEDDAILKAQRAKNEQLDLESELKQLAADLDDLSPFARKCLVVVKSNHDEFLEQYLRKCMYAKDPHNHYISLKLAQAAFEGLDPLQFAVEELVQLDGKTNVRWLKRNEDFKVARIQLGAHGDNGPNGAKGTLANMERAYGFSVTGHSHVPEILRGAWSVGTTSYLKLGYNSDSPSSWMNTCCIVWSNGQRQLINCIAGNHILRAA